MVYGDHKTDDQVAAGRGQGGLAAGAGVAARVLLEVLPQGLHPAPAVRPAGAQDVLQDRLPRPRRAAAGLPPAPRGPRHPRRPALLDPLLRRRPAAKKGEVVLLLLRATARAKEGGLIGVRPTATI